MTTVANAILTDQGAAKIQKEVGLNRAILLTTIYVGTLRAGFGDVKNATYADFEKESCAIIGRYTQEGETHIMGDLWQRVKDIPDFTYDTIAVSDGEGTLMYIGQLLEPKTVTSPEEAEATLNIGVAHLNVKVSTYHRSSVNQETMEDFVANRSPSTPVEYTSWDGTDEDLAGIKTGSFVAVLVDVPAYEVKAGGLYYLAPAPEGQTQRKFIQLEGAPNTSIQVSKLGTLIAEQDEYGVITKYQNLTKGMIILADISVTGKLDTVWNQTYKETGLYFVTSVGETEAQLPLLLTLYEPSLPSVWTLGTAKVMQDQAFLGFSKNIKLGDYIRSEATESTAHPLNPSSVLEWKKGGLYQVSSLSPAENNTYFLNAIPLVEPVAGEGSSGGAGAKVYELSNLVDDTDPQNIFLNAQFQTLSQGDLVRNGTGVVQIGEETYPTDALYIVKVDESDVRSLSLLTKENAIYQGAPTYSSELSHLFEHQGKTTDDTVSYWLQENIYFNEGDVQVFAPEPWNYPVSEPPPRVLRILHTGSLTEFIAISKNIESVKQVLGGPTTSFLDQDTLTAEQFPLSYDRSTGEIKDALGSIITPKDVNDVDRVPLAGAREASFVYSEKREQDIFSLTSAWSNGDIFISEDDSSVVNGVALQAEVNYVVADGQLKPINYFAGFMEYEQPTELRAARILPDPDSSNHLQPTQTNALTRSTFAEAVCPNTQQMQYVFPAGVQLAYLVVCPIKLDTVAQYEHYVKNNEFSGGVYRIYRLADGRPRIEKLTRGQIDYVVLTTAAASNTPIEFNYIANSYFDSLIKVNGAQVEAVASVPDIFTTHLFYTGTGSLPTGLKTLAGYSPSNGKFQGSNKFETTEPQGYVLTSEGVKALRKGDSVSGGNLRNGLKLGYINILTVREKQELMINPAVWNSQKYTSWDFTSGIRKGICTGAVNAGTFGPFKDNVFETLETLVNSNTAFLSDVAVTVDTP